MALEHLFDFGVCGNWNQDIVPIDTVRLAEINRIANIPSTQPVKAHKCSKCGKCYAQKQGLFNHMKFREKIILISYASYSYTSPEQVGLSLFVPSSMFHL